MDYFAYARNPNYYPTDSDQSYNADVESPNDMLVDSDDILVDAENEKDDVAIITPDSDVDQPGAPRADDCTSTPWPPSPSGELADFFGS
jgi:hypothetical protein